MNLYLTNNNNNNLSCITHLSMLSAIYNLGKVRISEIE